MPVKPTDEKKQIVTECCIVEIFGDYTPDMVICPRCNHWADLIDVCGECDDEGRGCTCAEDAEYAAECARMQSLYNAEVKYGIHIPEGTKPELMPDLDGFF